MAACDSSCAAIDAESEALTFWELDGVLPLLVDGKWGDAQTALWTGIELWGERIGLYAPENVQRLAEASAEEPLYGRTTLHFHDNPDSLKEPMEDVRSFLRQVYCVCNDTTGLGRRRGPHSKDPTFFYILDLEIAPEPIQPSLDNPVEDARGAPILLSMLVAYPRRTLAARTPTGAG